MTTILHKMILLSAFLSCLPVSLTAFVGSGEEVWPIRLRNLLSTSDISKSNATGTSSGNPPVHVLVLQRERVPLEDTIRMWCTSTRPSESCMEYDSLLYKVTPDGGVGVIVQDNENMTSTRLSGGRCYVTTVFSMTASLDSNGTYACSSVRADEPHPATINHIRNEVTVYVCAEPKLQYSHTYGNNTIVVNATESCGFHGEITWLVNGRRIPRRSTITAAEPVVEGEDDTLAISNTVGCDEHAPNSHCNVTAEFTYILEHRKRVFMQMKEITGCCIDELVEVSTKTPKTENPKLDVTLRNDRLQSHVDSTTDSLTPEVSTAIISIAVMAVPMLALLVTTCYYRGKWKNLQRDTIANVSETTE